MARIVWDKVGERRFETGVDRGIIYPKVGAPAPWNGLTAVRETSEGGEIDSVYFEGVKRRVITASSDFTATVDAISSPEIFILAEGFKPLAPGLYADQQPRPQFGFSYRTLKGNDRVGIEMGYKLNLVYNCLADSSDRSYSTITNTVSTSSRSWTFYTVPPDSDIFKPTARLIIDSNNATPAKLVNLENVLYGTTSTSPRLPSMTEVISILS